MKAFVTGSTGQLGNNLIRGLVREGHQIKALARSAEKAERVLGDLDIEIVHGDMSDVAGFAGELKGCDVLYHTAAYFREYYQAGEHEDKLHSINVEGSLNLLEAAVAGGVDNVVYTSTGGVLDPGTTEGPVDESAPYNYETPNLYFRSKIEAEKAIYQFIADKEIRVIFIMPGVMLGPWDDGPSALGKVMIDFLRRKVPAIPPGGFSFVDARDVSDAMIRAQKTGASGERFLVAGEKYYDAGTFFKIMEGVSGVPAPRVRLSYPVAFAFAWLSEMIGNITGRPPQLTCEGVRVLVETETVSSAKAIRMLDVKFRPLEETIRDQINWYQDYGYVSKVN